MRVWFIGETNPYQAPARPGEEPDHTYDLFPRPDRSAGARLCRVLGLPESDYLLRYERRNLLQAARWSVPAARRAADALLEGHPLGDRLVLLGAKVAAAFGCAFQSNLCEPSFMQVGTRVLRGRGVLVVPHPSGRSRLWNEKGTAERVREAVLGLDAGTGGEGEDAWPT